MIEVDAVVVGAKVDRRHTVLTALKHEKCRSSGCQSMTDGEK